MIEPASPKRLYIFVDYRGGFYHSARRKDSGMDVTALENYFAELDYQAVVRRFSDVDFRNQNYAGEYVLYQSTEDRDLLYKSYIEDILLGLQSQGAILIPDFSLFRAHHNKVFMEILRDLKLASLAGNIRSIGFGAFEDFADNLARLPDPAVMKPAQGAMSTNIKLIQGAPAQSRYARQISKSLHFVDAAKNWVKSYVRPFYAKKSNHRRKFIVQNYVPNLQNDFKVLVYGKRYFVLLRRTRPDDFRASGSGLFEYTENLPAGLLDFAKQIYAMFETPYISLDIGFSGGQFFLFEFQAVAFGSYTLYASPFHFVHADGGWQTVQGKSNLERVFAESVVQYLEKR